MYMLYLIFTALLMMFMAISCCPFFRELDPIVTDMKPTNSSAKKHPILMTVLERYTGRSDYMVQLFKQSRVDPCECKLCELGTLHPPKLSPAPFKKVM